MGTCKDCIHYDLCADFNLTARADYKRGMQIVEDDGKPERCGFFKDRSKFVELPCKVGDIVYRIFENASGKVIGKREVIGVHSKRNNPCLIIDGLGMQNFKEIGKTVFFTHEEAEKALKER